MLRSEVGRQTGIKFTPTLAFVLDAVPESAANIEDLLRRAREADAEVARAAATATHAGDTDPYRKPPEDDGEDGDGSA
jgi:ribosome-binding factor A